MILDPREVALRHSSVSPMARVLSTAERVSETDANALLMGEPGVGKAALALHIHRHGCRADAAFTHVRCEGAGEQALHRALFGEVRDLSYRGGLFGAAQGGTLLLEEISELSPENQATLMNALSTTGSSDPMLAGRSVRLIATTSRPMERFVAKRRLRRDLLDVLAVPLVVPPLRLRPDDAVLVAEACWQRVASDRPLGADALEVVRSYPWPGNVREVEAFVLRLATSTAAGTVNRQDAVRALDVAPAPAAPKLSATAAGDGTTDLPCLEPDELAQQVQSRGLYDCVDWFEGSIIRWALGRTGGSRKDAAELLGLKRTTLVEKLRRRATHDSEPESQLASARWTPRLVVR